jgi:hypothetical protein
MQAVSSESLSKYIFFLYTKKHKERVGRTSSYCWLSTDDSYEGVGFGRMLG